MTEADARGEQHTILRPESRHEQYKAEIADLERSYAEGWTGYNLGWESLPGYRAKLTEIMRRYYPDCVDLKQVP